MNIDDMPAGRELDALVAEKVMGWALHGSCIAPIPSVRMKSRMECQQCHKEVVEMQLRTWPIPPSFSTDIAAAWEVVRKMLTFELGKERHPAKDGRSGAFKPVIAMEFFEHDDEYDVIFGRCKLARMNDDVKVRVGSFEEVPFAICKTALKVVM